MSFRTNSNVSSTLFARVQAALRPEHNYVCVCLSGCSAQLLKKVAQGLCAAGVVPEPHTEWTFECGETTVHQQPQRSTSSTLKSVVRIPFHIAFGTHRPHVVRVIPRGEVVIATEVVDFDVCHGEDASDTDDDCVKQSECLKIEEAVFSGGVKFVKSSPTEHFEYHVVSHTPPHLTWSQAESALAKASGNRNDVSVVYSRHRDPSKTLSLDYCAANALHLLVSLYDATLQVRFEA
jgi:hypothetical protein